MARKKLTKLSDNHLTAIRLKIEGHSCREIAEAVGVEIRTVHLWFSDVRVKEELQAQRAHVFDLFAERLTDLSLRAFHRLEQLADMELTDNTVTAEQKLEIIREILDRNPLTARKESVQRHALVPDVPDSVLIERFRSAVRALPPGVVEGTGTAVGTN